jgi:hypothetical protein
MQIFMKSNVRNIFLGTGNSANPLEIFIQNHKFIQETCRK